MKHHFELFADYFQVYLQDDRFDEGHIVSWQDQSIERLLDFEDGVVAIGTARNMTVPLTIETLENEPLLPNDLSAFDQINECDLEIRYGKMVVMGCTDFLPDAKRIDLPNGWYRLRLFYSNLEELTEDGLDGEDSYFIQLWRQEKPKGLQIIKQRKIKI